MDSQGHDGGGGGGGGGQRARVSLLVRNLNFHSSPDDVRMAFSEFGPIRDVYLPLDFHTGEPRGFGFVEFESSKDAYDAMYAMHNTVLHGSTIHVTIAKKGRSDPVQMRRRELRGEFDRDGPRNSHRDRLGRRWASSRSPSSFRYRPQQRRGRSGSGSGGSAYGGGAAGARPPHGGKGRRDGWMPVRDRDRSLSRDERRPRPRSSKSRRSSSPHRWRRSTSLSRSRSPGFRERRTFSSDESEEGRLSGARGRIRKERELYRSRGPASRSRRRSKGREHSSSYSRDGSRSRRRSSVSSRISSSSRRHSSKSSRSAERTDSLSPGGEGGAYCSRRGSRSRRSKESELDGEHDGRRNNGGSGTRRQLHEEDNHLGSSRSRSRSSTQTSEGRRRRSPSSRHSRRRRSRSRGSHREECGSRSRNDEDFRDREERDKRAREDRGETDAGKELHADIKEDERLTPHKMNSEEDTMSNLLDGENEEITPNGHSRSARESEGVPPNADQRSA